MNETRGEQRGPQTLRCAIVFIIASALCVAAYNQGKLIALGYPHTALTFNALSQGFGHYTESFAQEWRPRIFSVWAASMFGAYDSMVGNDPLAQETMFTIRVGAWVGMWLLLTNLVIIGARRERSLFFLFATYGAVSFGYMVPGDLSHRVYPWDMPALFTFWCFVALVDSGKFRWLLLLLPVATGFKETAMVLCVAYLFWDKAPWRRRLLYFVLASVACLAVKVAIDFATRSPRPVLTMTTGAGTPGDRFLLNLRYLRQLTVGHPIFINAGTLLAFLLLPGRSQRLWMLRTICLLFSAGIFVCGIIAEYRIWFEMIPIALYGLELHFGGMTRDS